MTINLYSFVDLYTRQLAALAHILKKGAAFASEKGISESEMLGWRLIEDMQPLAFQIMVVCNFTQAWTARVAGLPVPAEIDQELKLAEYHRAIDDAKNFLAAIKPAQFAGRDDIALKVALGNGMEPTLPAGQWLSNFATTNIYFHLSTAYGILRSRGVPIGKLDLFAGGL